MHHVNLTWRVLQHSVERMMMIVETNDVHSVVVIGVGIVTSRVRRSEVT